MKPEDIAKSGTELAEQTALFAWAAWNSTKYPFLEKLMFAIKNEEKSGSRIVGARFKASGVKSGTHDVFVSIPRREGSYYEARTYHGLYIEMKTKIGSPSKEQIAFGEAVEAVGYAWEVCYGWEHAVRVLEAYLKNHFIQKSSEAQKLKYNKC